MLLLASTSQVFAANNTLTATKPSHGEGSSFHADIDHLEFAPTTVLLAQNAQSHSFSKLCAEIDEFRFHPNGVDFFGAQG
jgi:hypothetical protein